MIFDLYQKLMRNNWKAEEWIQSRHSDTVMSIIFKGLKWCSLNYQTTYNNNIDSTLIFTTSILYYLTFV